jgi:hypothetical protein
MLSLLPIIKSKEMHYCSNLFDKVHYMFQGGPQAAHAAFNPQHSYSVRHANVQADTKLRPGTMDLAYKFTGGIIRPFILLWRCDPTRVIASSFLMFLDNTQRHTKLVGLLWKSHQFVAETST